MSKGWDHSSEIRPPTGLYFIPRWYRIHEWVRRAYVECWQGKKKELREEPVRVSLCPPQIPHGMTGARTRASGVRGRRLTAWAMALPRISVGMKLVVAWSWLNDGLRRTLSRNCWFPWWPTLLQAHISWPIAWWHFAFQKLWRHRRTPAFLYLSHLFM
jgi:hypothetical protein